MVSFARTPRGESRVQKNPGRPLAQVARRGLPGHPGSETSGRGSWTEQATDAFDEAGPSHGGPATRAQSWGRSEQREALSPLLPGNPSTVNFLGVLPCQAASEAAPLRLPPPLWVRPVAPGLPLGLTVRASCAGCGGHTGPSERGPAPPRGGLNAPLRDRVLLQRGAALCSALGPCTVCSRALSLALSPV